MKTLLFLPVLLLKLLAWALVIIAPAIGVWVASSIATYMDGPVWLAVAIGALLCPVGPVVWDLWATSRFERNNEQRVREAKDPKERHLPFADRFILRTFFLNLGFLAALLATYPQVGFTALAARGDWFLDEWESPRVEVVRPVLFAGAEKLEWLYELSHEDNPYERWADDEPLPTPDPSQFGDARVEVDPTKTGEAPVKPAPAAPVPPVPPVGETPTGGEAPTEVVPPAPTPTPEPPSIPAPRAYGEAPSWPMNAELHPVVKNIPPEIETSYVAVARYIAELEKDPFLRVKALHDWVADRIAYDAPALARGEYPRQDAEYVFQTRKAVCAGYSRLLVAMGEETGDEILYVTGDARQEDGSISGSGHAWNAVKIEGKYYLIDATWNAGSVKGEKFTKRYRTEYLFTPPEVFGMDHLPDDAMWQLRSDPITRGEFVRQPMMDADFYGHGLRLISPQRSQVDTTDGVLNVRLENPRRREISATVKNGERCSVSGARDVRIRCRVSAGTHMVTLFAGMPGDQTLWSVGEFQVVSR